MRYLTYAIVAGLAAAPAFAAPATLPTDPIAAELPTTAPAAPATAPATVLGHTPVRRARTIHVSEDTATLTPTTAPAAVVPAVSTPAEVGSILVFPLTESSGASYPWVGKAVQSDLVAELTRTTRAHVQAAAAPVSDADAALEAGRKSGASIVVHGQFQAVSRQMRFTGQVLDVATGKAIGGFTATGDANNLFPLEDAMTGQVLHALPAAWLTVLLAPPATQPVALDAEPDAVPPPPPASAAGQTPQAPEYYSYTYPDYGTTATVPYYYPYYYGAYPYYWYAYPYYGPDIYFGFGFDHFHGRYFHHGFGRGFYGHGYGGSYHGGFHGAHAFSAHPAFGGHGGGGSFHGGGGHAGGGHGGGGGHGR